MDDPRKEEELQLDEESVSDIDVPDEDAEDVKGGMMANEPDAGCSTRSDTGCSGTVSKRKTCR